MTFTRVFRFYRSNYEKSIVESVQDDANEENTVKTYGRRRPKKMSSVRKKPETGVSYELKETHDGIAAAAHFISDPSKYNTAVHPHYDGIKNPLKSTAVLSSYYRACKTYTLLHKCTNYF